MKIVISRMHYNEYDAILKTHPKFCQVQYVDGRFPDFPKIDDCNSSTDGSNGLIDSFENAELHSFSGKIIPKTNYQFQLAKDYDVMILLACDEYIVGDWQKFTKEIERLYNEEPNKTKLTIPFEVVSGDLRPMKSKDRIFFDPANWKVVDWHWNYYYKNQKSQTRNMMANADITSIKIVHDDRVRDPARNELMKIYQDIGEEKTG